MRLRAAIVGVAVGGIAFLVSHLVGRPVALGPAVVLAVLAGAAWLLVETIVVAFTSDGPSGGSERRARSIAIALALAGLAVLFYVATLVRLGSNVFNRPL